MKNEHSDPSGREQRTSLWLNAPVERVWEVWTKPGHIQHWWGPDGFTNTIEKMQVEVGGEHWYKMYETRELFEIVEKHHKTSEGFKQTVDKLNTYLNQNKGKDRYDVTGAERP